MTAPLSYLFVLLLKRIPCDAYQDIQKYQREENASQSITCQFEGEHDAFHSKNLLYWPKSMGTRDRMIPPATTEPS